ncbi:hypothetical protein CYG49_04775 [Candidatus Saccharibacteria bacterium]|nr:MAG: hypothetical protein CYG49_04775 [Candidatus Saccharibacteria bacterium]
MWLITEVTGKLRYVLLAYLLSRGLAIVIFSIIEGWHPLEAHWWSGVSALTIGYGDFFPKTVHGRLIADVFQHFWIFYCAPAIAAHVLIKLFKNLSAFTHREQEWLFWVIGLLFKRQMWQIRATLLIAQHMGIADQLPPVPGRDMDGSFLDLPRQPHDFDDIDEEFSLPPHEPDEHVHESA